MNIFDFKVENNKQEYEEEVDYGIYNYSGQILKIIIIDFFEKINKFLDIFEKNSN